MAITFEGYERRIAQIDKACEQYGIKDLEEALKLCTDRGFNPYDITTGIQSIAFENAKWAYTLGCAIALKKAEKGEVTTASEAAAAIGEGLQAFCVPGSVADDRKVGLGHGNLGAKPGCAVRRHVSAGAGADDDKCIILHKSNLLLFEQFDHIPARGLGKLGRRKCCAHRAGLKGAAKQRGFHFGTERPIHCVGIKLYRLYPAPANCEMKLYPAPGKPIFTRQRKRDLLSIEPLYICISALKGRDGCKLLI